VEITCRVYRPRRPRESPLYQLVERHLEQMLGVWARRFARLIWSYPLKEVNRYIERLVDAGFEDRVMFGTDQMAWPKLMAYSISIIQNADYPTPKQKRDILYFNTARFLRLDKSQSK
jgi:predicted TIM-barrel fold metal-dependent hydrolase